MKKKMYYNMRIKTVKRNTSTLLRKAREASGLAIANVHALIAQVVKEERELEREEDEKTPLTRSPDFTALVAQKKAKLREALTAQEAVVCFSFNVK